jgi:hypothetical protein
MRAHRIGLDRLEPVPPHVRPAGHFVNRASGIHKDPVVAAVGIGLQITAITRQELLGAIAAPTVGEVVDRVRMVQIADVSPEPRRASFIEQRIE